MKDILEKISTYNLFNYLFPGVVFVVLADAITDYSFVQQDVVIGLFMYYFVGLAISRVGSLVVEPLLKRASFLKFADYKDYVAATKKDERVELLSEVNNTYRTLCACFGLLVLLKMVEFLGKAFSISKTWEFFVLVVTLLIIFLFSYKKQTDYVKKRVDANK